MGLNEKAQSAEILKQLEIVADQNGYPAWYAVLRDFDISPAKVNEMIITAHQNCISQLESDLAKSQEKCKAYEEALEKIASSAFNWKDIIRVKYLIAVKIAEQALKPKEDETRI